MKILAYADRFSAFPGEKLDIMVSCETADYTADVVKLIHGDTHPDGPGFKAEPVASNIDGIHKGRIQEIQAGSHIVLDDPRHLLRLGSQWTLQTFVAPTRLASGEQTILGRWNEAAHSGYRLLLTATGHLAVQIGAGEGRSTLLTAPRPILEGAWYLVYATLRDGALSLHQIPLIGRGNGRFSIVSSTSSLTARVQENTDIIPFCDPGTPFLMAAHGRPDPSLKLGYRLGGLFNGKLDRPRVHDMALSEAQVWQAVRAVPQPALIGAWDFQAEITPQGIRRPRRITDVSGRHLHGRTVNLPTRAVVGHNWQAREQNFIHAPEQYGAIHFHQDDLDDARWDVELTLGVPQDLPSALYAVRLRAGDDVEYVPFYVRARQGQEKKIVFLAPTASYLAYANDHVSLEAPLAQVVFARTPVFQQGHLILSERRELGLSTYDCHRDGSGVVHSSRLRPILNMRPGFRHWFSPSLWQFNADLHLIDWLIAKGYEFDVLTDDDLHAEGVAALSPYDVLITGTHPEYVSEQMLDALHDYVDAGGRMMYMGANGFYWVTAFDPDGGAVIEVRKGHGSGAWKSRPGEYHLSFTGEYGSLWLHRGRAPQKLFGIGFGAEGFDISSPYIRMPDSELASVSWMFEGISREELLGDFGLVGDGAAGLEVDIYDTGAGSPPEALIVASSVDHTPAYCEVSETLFYNGPGTDGTHNPKVRADIVFFPTGNHGAVWSSGSIAYCGSLSHKAYDNNISRLTGNVLDRFLDPSPFD